MSFSFSLAWFHSFFDIVNFSYVLHFKKIFPFFFFLEFIYLRECTLMCVRAHTHTQVEGHREREKQGSLLGTEPKT